ncbi:MAG: Rrf2 family transcriptional regulator [Eubacteriales bacterium]|nr:Rrf2 family transcriptional regulator [Eubacteriales bacterium]
MNSDFIVAVHAMVYLHHKAETLSSEVLAANVCTNPARIRRVMSKLKKAGLVETKEGRLDGGYSYEKTKRVTLGEISEALDVRFAETNWHSGNEDLPCQVASGMAGYIDSLYGTINEQCREYLDGITVADVEKELFRKDHE